MQRQCPSYAGGGAGEFEQKETKETKWLLAVEAAVWPGRVGARSAIGRASLFEFL